MFLGAANPDRLGYSVDGAGDVDRDGYADVIVGAPFRQTPKAGAAFVYSGRDGSVLLTLVGPHYGDRFGCSVAGVWAMWTAMECRTSSSVRSTTTRAPPTREPRTSTPARREQSSSP